MPFLAAIPAFLGTAAGAATLGAAGTIAGGLISGNATKKAQQQANATNQRLADEKNAFDWNNYLLQRGYNAGGTARPGEIPTTASAVNTSLPLWASINGQPAEQALLNRILETSGVLPAGARTAGAATGGDPLQSEQALAAFYNSEPAFAAEYARLTATGAERRTPVQWLRDHLQASPETMQQFYAFSSPAAPDLETTATAAPDLETTATSVRSLIDPSYADLQRKAIEAANQLFDGRYLQQQQDALVPILQARNTAADEIYGAGARSAGGVYDASLLGAGELYDATGTGARSIYDADRLATDDLFGARDRAARSIYDSDLLQADTYQQSALQALNRLLGQNAATRARQGFTGTTSGDALTRARLLADYTQQGAGVRAGAGQSLAQRLADAAVAQATGRGVAGQSLAQRLAEAGITLAGNRGAAGLVRAGSLGTYDIGRATTRAQAGEQDAMSRLALLTDDINRRLAGLNLPSTLAGNELSIRSAGAAGRYSDLDALLSRLSMFRTSATPSSLATPNVSPVVNNGQILGSAVSSLAQSYGEYKGNQDILAAIRSMSGGTYKGIPVLNTPATATSSFGP